jgi:hypothetical protein
LYRKFVIAALLTVMSALGQPAKCGDITPGQNVSTGGSFNGFIPWSPNSGWNQDISGLPVDSRSALWINTLRWTVDRRFRAVYSIAVTEGWQTQWEGLPYSVVSANQPRVDVSYDGYPDDSDPGPFPIPADAVVQGTRGPGTRVDLSIGGDRHIITIDRTACLLYELWNVSSVGSNIVAGTGAVYDLTGGDHQRPYFKTGGGSVSGLPLMAGALRYDEILQGEIKHALAFTGVQWQGSQAFTGMASHHQYLGGYDPATPPFGVKVRLRADFDISKYTPQNQIILKAMKKYGMVLVDGGSPIDLFAASDTRWDFWSNYEFYTGLFLTNSGDFQIVQTGPIYCDAWYSCGAQPPLGPKPVINSLEADHKVVVKGTPVTLHWNVDGVPSRIRFITPEIGPIVTDSVVVHPTHTQTYTLMVQNENGRSTQDITIEVKEPALVSVPNPVVTFDNSPHPVSASTSPRGLSSVVTYNGANELPIRAGVYAVSAVVNDPLYMGSAKGTLTIKQANPTIFWPSPAAIRVGSALGNGQLNATANIPGIFTYAPPMGTVLGIGKQTLTAVFTPLDPIDYSTASTSTAIDILAVPEISPMQVSVTKVLTRDLKNNVVIQLTVTNTSNRSVSNLVLSSVKIGAVDAPKMPVPIGRLDAGASATVVINMASPIGVSGSAGTLSVTARSDAGSVMSNARINLP